MTAPKKTKADVQKLIQQSQAAIDELQTSNNRLQESITGLEKNIAEASAARDQLELFSATAAERLVDGSLTLQQFAENGNAIDLQTAAIERLENLHDDVRQMMAQNEQRIAELTEQLLNRREMLMSLEAEQLAESIIKKSGNEIKMLLAIIGRKTDQPSGAIAGVLIEKGLFPGGSMPFAEKRKLLATI